MLQNSSQMPISLQQWY